MKNNNTQFAKEYLTRMREFLAVSSAALETKKDEDESLAGVYSLIQYCRDLTEDVRECVEELESTEKAN